MTVLLTGSLNFFRVTSTPSDFTRSFENRSRHGPERNRRPVIDRQKWYLYIKKTRTHAKSKRFGHEIQTMMT